MKLLSHPAGRMMRSAVLLVIVAGIVTGPSCSQRPRDPVAVARAYFEAGRAGKTAGMKNRYALLSADSRKVTSLDEFLQHHEATPKGWGGSWTLDSLALLPEDKNLPTYRRVRGVAHSGTDTPSALESFHYTLVNENGVWAVVWEKALLDHAGDLYQKGMLDEAIAVSDKALALNPYSAAAYDRKAWCYARQTPAGYDERQSCNSAIELNAKKAVALEPEDPAHYNTLSLAYDAQDLPELVLECYQKAIRLPTCTPSERALYYVNSAGAYFKMSKDEKALESTDSALAIDSASTMALTMRARILLYRDRADSAKVAIDRALATHWERRLDKGTQFDLLLLAAMIEAVLRDYDRALAHVVRALEMQPSDKPAQELYAHIKRNIK